MTVDVFIRHHLQLHIHMKTYSLVILTVCVCAEKAEVCLFQGVTVLGPGQSLVQYFEGELCYTVHCLNYKDPDTGFYAMEITSVNCSQKCGPVSIQHIEHIMIDSKVIAQSDLDPCVRFIFFLAPGVFAILRSSGVLRLLQKCFLYFHQ